MSTLCDNCNICQQYEELEGKVEQIYSLAQAAEMSDLRREHPRGWRDALRRVVEILKETT